MTLWNEDIPAFSRSRSSHPPWLTAKLKKGGPAAVTAGPSPYLALALAAWRPIGMS